jgi:hypothetical protein
MMTIGEKKVVKGIAKKKLDEAAVELMSTEAEWVWPGVARSHPTGPEPHPKMLHTR